MGKAALRFPDAAHRVPHSGANTVHTRAVCRYETLQDYTIGSVDGVFAVWDGKPLAGNGRMTSYFVDGQRQQTDENTLEQHQILEKAGYSSTDYYLVSESGHEYRNPNGQVPISEGEKFQIKPLRVQPAGNVILYEVNGESQTTERSPLTLKVILENAGRGAGVDPADLQSYRLENLATGLRYNNLDDPVPIRTGDKFVAIYTGATPVA